MFCIYILHSASSGSYYVGHTDDAFRRLEEHNDLEKSITYTSKHRPWTLEAIYECSGSRAEAMKVEKFIKAQKSKKLIERMVKGEPLTGVLAQLVRVPHVRD